MPAINSESFKQATTATLRAIAGSSNQVVIYGANPGLTPAGAICLPDPANTRESSIIVRGMADAAALRLRYHDPEIHATYRIYGGWGDILLDRLEQIRVETIGSLHMPGMKTNLAYLYLQTPTEDDDSGAESLLRMIISRAGCRFTAGDYPAQRTLEEVVGSELQGRIDSRLDELSSNLHNQTAFAISAGKLIAILEIIFSDVRIITKHGSYRESPVNTEIQKNSSPMQLEQESPDELPERAEDSDDKAQGPSPLQPFVLKYLFRDYRIYTRQFDEEIEADALCPQAELQMLRSHLDGQLTEYQRMINRLAHRLQRHLLASQRRRWLFDLEEGVLNAGRLAGVATNPTDQQIYKNETECEFPDTIVTLLIDNSGSMRGRPIKIAALCTDIVTRTLERCHVKVEVLGFTTGDGQGGKAYQKWRKDGRPTQPGRLNATRHIIYKSADEPWHRGRHRIGLMLKEEILKENVDGEALLWAFGRLLRRPEKRRIIIVISDGAPVDEDTINTEGREYLADHLKAVTDWIESRSDMQLLAIGILHDVNRYYRNAATISSVDQLGPVLLEKLTHLIG